MPFANAPRVRWVTVPAAVVIYIPTFLTIYHSVGSVAFASSFLFALVVAALAGIKPGLVTAACIQTSNFGLVNVVGAKTPHPVGSAVVALFASSALVVAIGGARLLLRHMSEVNRELDRQIRQRNAMASNLAESLTLHRNLLATLGEGVGVFDSEDRFLFANAAAEELFGLGPGQLVGKTLAELLTPESLEAFGLKSPDSAAGSSRSSYDLHLAGNPSRVLLATETRMAQGTSAGYRTLRVLRDLTARAQLEHERHELELYLQRTNALQSLAVLAGGVAHDFNNLLSGVLGSAELGMIRLIRAPDLAQQCFEDIRKYAMEASELSRKMLDYAGKRAVAREAVCLADEVNETLKLISSTIANKASLHNEIPEALPHILADRTGLHQVITNLILNAVEATPDASRGRITLRAKTQSVVQTDTTARDTTAPAPGRYVVFSVSDTGIGIAEEARARLFEPFFSTKFQGRGMGLAATLGIVRALKGGIQVESQAGIGTTFSIYLPLATDPIVKESSVCAPIDECPRNVTVLLVDDESVVRETTTLLLAELGCTVKSATSGRDAVQYFATAFREVDIVLLDLTMPEQSGFEVLAALRTVDPNVRVILTSGYSVHDTVDPLAHEGVVGFLPKPHQLATLESSLRRGLGVERHNHASRELGILRRSKKLARERDVLSSPRDSTN